MELVELLLCLAFLAAAFILRSRSDAPAVIRARRPAAEKSTTTAQPALREKQPPPAPAGGKRRKKQEWKTKNNYSQLLPAKTMVHSDNMLEGCSRDGNYLVSGAEDEPPPDPDSNSSGSEAGKDNCSPSESPSGSPLGSPCVARRSTRRRRRTRTREQRQQSSPAPPSPVPQPEQQLSRFKDLNISEGELAGLLNYYSLTTDQLTSLGYPVKCTSHPSRAIIYSIDFKPYPKRFDVNAREFVPRQLAANAWQREEDSGQGSGSSSPRSPDSDPDSEEERTKLSVQRRCVRCQRHFYVSNKGEYITNERCRHHWGRLKRVSLPHLPPDACVWQWGCCGGNTNALGCSRAPVHVWSGMIAGINSLDGFVRTKPRSEQNPGRHVLALDCEMCYTTIGLQVAQLVVVGADGRIVYSTFVSPELPIIDYNTRFSGISAKHMHKVNKTLKDVQADLLELIDEETILVGHGLENDLRALKILHGRVVDTAISFPHERGPPYRRSLKLLALEHLDIDIQSSKHCPLEDARVSLDLMLWRVHRDFLDPPSG